MNTLLLAGVLTLIPSLVFAQTSDSRSAPAAQSGGGGAAESSLATSPGHEVSFTLTQYLYVEPGDTSIAIHGAKLGGEYTGTLALNRRRHWFAQADVRGVVGSATYDGWCSPFLIRPNSASPNGYALGVGDPSPCSESGDSDWYVEARGLVGKDLIGEKWAWSPYAGLGFRYLSNGTTGTPGYRTDNYLSLPVGMRVRTEVASRHTLAFGLEYDRLLRGWQTTRQSALGGGQVPATATAPAFTIVGFTDFSFTQHEGWALRANVKYQVASRWVVEPYYVRWNVSSSPVSSDTVTFIVNNVTAREQFRAFEPLNVTQELGVKLGVRF